LSHLFINWQHRSYKQEKTVNVAKLPKCHYSTQFSLLYPNSQFKKYGYINHKTP